MSNLQQVLLSCFVLSTWLFEKLPVAPYLAFVGLPRSGKTTDETATVGDRRALFHLLRVGSTPGSVAIRKNMAFNGYCPKVVCWTELPNDQALNSRCVIIPLQETVRKDLLRVTDPKIQALANDARQMLQQYRFENFNRLSLARVPGDESLNSRTRDLYEALALPIDDANIREFLAVQFQLQQDFNREPLSPVQASVLKTLDWHIHTYRTDPMYANGGLTDAVNLRLQYDHEVFHASPHQVGHVLTSFGLTERKRTNAGWVRILSRDMRNRIHTLLRRYAVELDSSVNREGCSLCGTPKAPSGASESAAVPEKTALSDGPTLEGGELGELRALKTA